MSERGFTISSTMKNLLRQDPDLVVLNEIRDEETAYFACNMSLTGHLVLTTLHAYNVNIIPMRLFGLGVTNPMFLSQLDWASCQHLAIKLCNHCKEKYKLDDSDRELLKVDFGYKKVGCSYCNQTGYFERIMIPEYISFTDSHKSLIEIGNFIEYSKLVVEDMAGKTIQDKAINYFKDGVIDLYELKKIL